MLPQLFRSVLRFVSLFAVLGCACAQSERPNIVLIFADDLGYGDLGCFGHPLIQTPNIDSIAAKGVRLTSFYSAPTCVPARAQLITGKYYHRIKFGGSVGPAGGGAIPDDEITLAEALKSAGYDTAMAGKWHLGNGATKSLPTAQGFDTWVGLPYSNDMIPPWVRTDVPLWLYDSERIAAGKDPVERPVDQTSLTARYTQRAVEFIRKQRSAPFFFYLAPNMPHLPLRPGERFRGKSRAGLYGDVIEEIDWSVGEVLKAVREAGKERNTIVIFTSDNGPWSDMPVRMLQDNNLPWHAGTSGLLRASKASTYEGGPRVPAVIHWPGNFEGGWSTPELTATMDLYSTLIRVGTGQPARQPTDGHDLTDFLSRKQPKSPRTEYFYFNSLRLEGVRMGEWKLRLKDGTELFNLELDPSERYNRAAELPDIVAKLTKRLNEMAATPGAQKNW
jgi:arylsulfatase A